MNNSKEEELTLSSQILHLVPPCQQHGLWRPSIALICSMWWVAPKPYIIWGQTDVSMIQLLTDLLEKEWTGKSCRFPHTKENLNWQFVDGGCFFCTIAQYHKGRRQIKDHTPDYSLHPHDHLEITVLGPPVKAAGHQNNAPVTLPPWDAVQKTQHMPKKKVQSPGNARQPSFNPLLLLSLERRWGN